MLILRGVPLILMHCLSWQYTDPCPKKLEISHETTEGVGGPVAFFLFERGIELLLVIFLRNHPAIPP